MATPPPTPPSPPKGDGTPDGGNPAHAAPPEVAPKPGRAKKSATKRQATPKAKSTTKQSAGDNAKGKSSTAPKPPSPPRAPAKPRAAARPRPRTTKLSVATAPGRPTPVDAEATASPTPYRRSWWRMVAGGVGALAAGAALFSLRGSTRRKAHQADGSDSSKSFDAGIADEGTIPDEPAQP